MNQIARQLRDLMAKATPGPWYATDAEYWEGHWADGSLSAREETWTVSTDPKAPGWNTDGGHPGYGISKADAELIAFLRTHAQEIIEALEAREA